MKKIAKMSLVAAVAVAGLTNVNAASLEEAIKNVQVSGQFRFRAEDSNQTTATNTTGTSANKTDVEIEIGLKAPVTDNVTAVFKIDNANDDEDSITKGGVTIEDYYFSYANAGTTVNYGQQNIPGRLTDGAQGDGIVALQKVGGFTVGAAAFMTNSITSGDDVYSVIGMGKVGPVSLLAQYATLPDVADSINVKADVNVGMITAGIEHSETGFDGASNENETTKLYAQGKMGIVSAKLTYASTGKDGSGSLHGAASTYSNSAETPSEFLLWQLGSATKSELSVIAFDASASVTPKVSVRLALADGEVSAAKTDISETLVQVSYKVAKNLSTYVRYSNYEMGTTEKDRGRVEVRYSF